MKPLIIIPAIHEQTTDACLKSIDKKFYENIMIVDNSGLKFGLKYGLGYTIYAPGNIGVARSWNQGVEAVIARNYDFLIILSASLIFNDGMNGFMEALERENPDNGMMTQEGWHCIAINRKVFETIGDFDTNCYPAYYEDSDFIRRMELAKIHEPTGAINFKGCSVDAKSVSIAHGMKQAGVKVNMGAVRRYFIEKWGSDPRYGSQADRDKLFKHPFNNPNFGLDYYPNRPIEELKLLYNLQ